MGDARRACADRLIVALDMETLPEAAALGRRLRGLVNTVKIGSALFTACGPQAIRRLRTLGFDVMLDLKFFDIPSTVERSCHAAVRHGVSSLTVHAAGGRAMLEAAVRGVRRAARRRRGPRPRVFGVTVLTSVRVARAGASVATQVLRLARTAREAGCDGVVASAHEVRALRRRFGRKLAIACPGIRPAAARMGDQQRVATPGAALRAGADILIVGRPITGSRRPRAAVQHILNEMAGDGPC